MRHSRHCYSLSDITSAASRVSLAPLRVAVTLKDATPGHFLSLVGRPRSSLSPSSPLVHFLHILGLPSPSRPFL